MKKFLSLVMVGLLIFTIFGCTKKEEVNMGKGTKMTLVFVSNPTTGFDWEYALEGGEGELELLDNTFLAPDEEGVFGAAGKRQYVFKGTKPGKVNLKFTYRRPWEGGETAYDVVYELDVEDDLSISCLSKSKGVVDSDKDLMSFPDPVFE